MSTATRTEAPAAATQLQLMWLASPALPVGGFSYSEGLEAAVEARHIGTEADTTRWLCAQLQGVLARGDLVVLARAHALWAQEARVTRATATDPPALVALNDWMRCTRETAEQRQQSEQMGRSMLEWLRHSAWAADARIGQLARLAPAPAWTVAFALATVLAQAPRREAALAYAAAWSENMAQAAMRAVPLGQAAAQRILAALAELTPAAVQAALEQADRGDEPVAFAPQLAVLSAQHEVQYSRLFRS